ncbi:MAG: MarR family transcriptional regulator [Lachnospiraceae bacterium]|jgi:DNA-binding MarR family transcriptional regulator|nr:MarR family transcriptional regulator [Lachnospiraceae bacterium]
MDNISKMALIFGNIFSLSNKLQTLGDRMDDYMSMKQWMLVAAISKSGKEALNISELASIIGTSYQNVKKMAVILERQGFLTLQRSTTDSRVVLISITKQCKDYFAKRADIEDAFLRSIFDNMDEKMIDDLYDGIIRLHENANKTCEIHGY